MENVKKGITVAGSLIADIFYEIDTYPAESFLTQVRGTSTHIGGSGNIILDLAKLDEGLQVKVCGIVGRDAGGKSIMSVLSKYPNVNTSNVTVE